MPATNYILGLRPEDEGLRLDPCIPAQWSGFTATSRFRGHLQQVEVRNPAHLQRGVAEFRLDGRALTSPLIPAALLHDGARLVGTLGAHPLGTAAAPA